MSERKAISKSVRFEVFKRDGFQCQYCGAKAPEAVLHVDHVKPVAEGGTNDLLNLVTACQPCNLGKGARELSDDSALQKQRSQLDALNQRREQLEMLVSWREGLLDIQSEEVEALVTYIGSLQSLYSCNDNARANIKKWLKRFSLAELFDAAEASFSSYLRADEPSDEAVEQWEKAFAYIPRIASVKKRGGYSNEEQRLFYIRGILRNRLNYVNERVCIILMRQAAEIGADISQMQDVACSVRSWTEFRDIVEAFIEKHDGGGDDD